jgi:hypothetical protein
MHDHFSDLYEWDENGNKRRKKRVARDREQINFSMTMMDHSAFGFHSTFSDGSPDYTSPHKPGHRFLDVNDEARLQADTAYEQMRERLHYKTNRRRQQQDANEPPPTSTRTLDELRAAASAAYEARSKRMAGRTAMTDATHADKPRA